MKSLTWNFIWKGSVLLAFLFLSATGNGISAEQRIDSLKLLATDSNPHQLDALLELAKAYTWSNPTTAFAYGEKAFSLAPNKLAKSQALKLSGAALSRLGNHQKALQYFEAAALLLANTTGSEETKELSRQWALAYKRVGQLDSARAILLDNLESPNTNLKMEILIDLVEIELVAGIPMAARQYLQEARALLYPEAPQDLQARLETITGRISLLLGKNEQAKQHYNTALSMLAGSSNKLLIANCYLVLIDLETIENNFEEVDRYEALAKKILSEDNARLSLALKTRKGARIRNEESPAKSVEMHLEVLEGYQKLGDLRNEAHTMLQLTKGYLTMSNKAKAMSSCIEALKLSDPFKGLKLKCLLLLSHIYWGSNEVDKAEEYLNQAAVLAEESGHQFDLITIVQQKAFISAGKQDWKEAIVHHKTAIKLTTQLGFQVKVLNSQSLLALHYFFDHQHEQAYQAIEKALAMKDVLATNHLRAMTTYRTAGQIFRGKSPERSIAYFKKTMELNREFKSISVEDNCLYFLSLIYERSKDYKQAFFYQNKLLSFRDSIHQKQSTEQLAQVKAQFETEQKDQALAAIQKDKKLQDLTLATQQAEIAQKQEYLLLSIFGFVILTTIGGLLFNRYQLRQNAHKLKMTNRQMALETQNTEARKQLEMEVVKTRFFADVSHELRTPLTLIQGPLEQMIANDQPDVSQLKSVLRNTTRLTQLLDQTLDLSMIESGHMPLHLSKQPITDFVKSTAQTFSALAQAKKISLKIVDNSENPIIDFDPQKIEIVLMNLLGNAFKHTAKNSTVSVTISQYLIQNGSIHPWVKVVVSDSGRGIEQEHLPHVFDRYYRGDTTGVNGSGIGLSLAKEIILLHEGSIEVISQLGVGSSFSFHLPTQLHNGQKSASVRTDKTSRLKRQMDSIDLGAFLSETICPDASDRPVVLVIEDNTEVRHYLQQLLATNYRVLTANSGDQGIAMAQKNSIDLILSDVMMPEKDGFEVTRLLKTQLTTCHIPVVLLTAKASQESKLAGLETGADDYVTKPFHAPELLARIKNLIEQRNKLRELFANKALQIPSNLASNKLDKAFLSKATDIVEQYLDDPEFSVEKFCMELALNRTSVHLKLKALTGKSTTQFIKHIRLQKAAKLIRQNNESMASVATMVGFNSRQAFNKSFKEQFKVTPSEFARI